jgi:hypothetical protein
VVVVMVASVSERAMVEPLWQMLREVRAGDDGDSGDGGGAAARRALAMCNPHARARMAAKADRGIDNPRSSKFDKKKNKWEKKLFSFVLVKGAD